MERRFRIAEFLENVERALTLLFFFWLPFGTRIALYQAPGVFFPYNTLFLYLLDLIVASILGLVFLRCVHREAPYGAKWWRLGGETAKGLFVRLSAPLLALFVFLGIALISALVHPAGGLSVAVAARLWLFAFFAVYIAKHIRYLGRFWLGAIFFSGVTQAIVAIAQFMRQQDAGLWFLGENTLSPALLGVAKIDVSGEKFIRAYGTLPHPNVLAAFLLFAVVLSVYAYLTRNPRESPDEALFANIPRDVILLGGIALMEIAFFFSFSRIGWAAGGVYTIITLLLWGSYRRHLGARVDRRRALAVVATTACVTLFTFLAFAPALKARATLSPDEQSFSLRLFLARTALYEINDHRYTGVGPGNFVQELSAYISPALPAWTYQPVHALYLLIAAEIGIAGLLAFLVFIGLVLRRAWRGTQNSIFSLMTFGIFIAFLFFGAFDHFFWTFEQGVTLWWIVVGLLLSEKHSL